MKISDVSSFLVGPPEGKNLCFVRVDTDDGVHGWGECYTQNDRDTQIASHVEKLSRYMVGRDPSHIKQFLRWVYDDFASRRGAMDLYCAVSGLEQALWDIVGKSLSVPVYTLLGGPCRDRIRVYANGWARDASTPEEIAEKATAAVSAGFTTLKFDPIPGPWRTHVQRDIEDQAVKNVSAVREAVGSEVEILIDMHRRLAPMHAVKIAREIERFDPFWLEEPVLAENIDALKSVKQEVSAPVVTGEELYTKFEFREVLESGAADIINPDVCNTGGILEFKEIAAMAEPYFVAVSPHNYNSTTVGLGATIHASAAIPNFLITEYFVNLESFGNEIAREPFNVQDGYIDLPEKPGLGIDLDEDSLADHPYRQEPPRRIWEYHEEKL